MPRYPWGSILVLCLTLACNDSSDSAGTPAENCSPPSNCAPSFKIWSPAAEAILLEKLGGPYAKEDAVPGLYLNRKEMSEAQKEALEEWAMQSTPDALNCRLEGSEIAYKAIIFDSEGGKKVYYGAENACGEAGPGAYYIPLTYFQNFPGEIPYRPDEAGDYTIDKVVINQNTLKIDVRYSDGCASFHNFVLMVDPAGSAGADRNAYLRYRSDNDCKKQSRSRLEFDLGQYNLQNAEFMRLKGWPKRLILPKQ
jgi:hypothetical protein